MSKETLSQFSMMDLQPLLSILVPEFITSYFCFKVTLLIKLYKCVDIYGFKKKSAVGREKDSELRVQTKEPTLLRRTINFLYHMSKRCHRLKVGLTLTTNRSDNLEMTSG